MKDTHSHSSSFIKHRSKHTYSSAKSLGAIVAINKTSNDVQVTDILIVYLFFTPKATSKSKDQMELETTEFTAQGYKTSIIILLLI